ncbi:glycosyltransferase family 4 protein [Hoeflea sp. TYP-13]|uniref:glycosyltransferase family 4 protein n=1 Tax=Hoeflea sp. TYP-13 TaxID=3230023 RepID=UPI0034C5B2FC
MATKKKIAFYAPLKSPDHPIPSGDREIARLMMKALRLAGYSVELVSDVISYQKRPSGELYGTRKSAVSAEENRIRRLWESDAASLPDLWFTYHPYCKSPDWLGLPLARHFKIPYVTAEACRTRQGTANDWLEGRAAAQEAIRFAKVNFVLKDSDWQYLKTVTPDMKTAVRITPFLDISGLPARAKPKKLFENEAPVLLAAGMMRPGAKMESYRTLAAALQLIENKDWNLIIAGEGPERANIAELLRFAGSDRVKFVGSVAHEDMFALMDSSDIFVWPGIGEAIGLVYLEAQARGMPVVALNTAGVPLVVSDGVGGTLLPVGDTGAYAAAIARLLDDRRLREELGAGGRRYVHEHHNVTSVAATFKSVIDGIFADASAANQNSPQ